MEKYSFSKFDLLQALIMAALVVFIIIIINSGKNQNASLTEIESALKGEPSVSALQQKPIQEAANTFSFDQTIVEEGIYFRVDDIMNVNELLVAKVSDNDNREQILEIINEYLEDKKNKFDGYGTDQYGLLSDAVVTEKGDYIFFGVSPDVLIWESDFSKCFR